jgi:hypothetical protein
MQYSQGQTTSPYPEQIKSDQSTSVGLSLRYYTILLSTLRFSKMSLSFRFSDKNKVRGLVQHFSTCCIFAMSRWHLIKIPSWRTASCWLYCNTFAATLTSGSLFCHPQRRSHLISTTVVRLKWRVEPAYELL